MSTYRRVYVNGGCYFFTVVTHQRRKIFQEQKNIDLLHESFTYTQARKSFTLNAIVILPDHIHCIWTQPDNDNNFSERWKMIKTHFSRQFHNLHDSNTPLWQPRFWEHLIRDDNDFKNHLDYIHYNPVKHDYVDTPSEWRNSTFKKFVKEGWYESGWGQASPDNIKQLDLE